MKEKNVWELRAESNLAIIQNALNLHKEIVDEFEEQKRGWLETGLTKDNAVITGKETDARKRAKDLHAKYPELCIRLFIPNQSLLDSDSELIVKTISSKYMSIQVIQVSMRQDLLISILLGDVSVIAFPDPRLKAKILDQSLANQTKK